MTSPGAPSAQDLERLQQYATAVADTVDAVLAAWVVRSVDLVHVAQLGRRPPQSVRDAAAAAGDDAVRAVGPKVRALLALDIDDQRGSPLALLRTAVPYPTEVLRDADVPAPTRDEFLARQFPDDIYDLSPAAFAEIDPALHEAGLMWGAAKAHVHLARRRAHGSD